jgi:micrococcal nuclease
MKPQTKTLIIVIICLIVLAIALAAAIFLIGYSDNSAAPENKLPDNTAVRIIDGDTFELASGDIVRLICVDTPELGKAGADEATEFLSSLILNKELRLENDSDDKDAYGRLLRYIYVNNSDEELFVNKMIVQQGYGSVFRYGNDTARCDEIGNES